MAESMLGGVIEFFNDIGMYEVILPFLLVFTLVFAILDKTRVFGTDEIGGKKYPKKNINAMIAFVIAFFVIASAELVQIITQVSSQVVILLLASVLFLMLIGSFMKETDEGVYLPDKWQGIFMVAMLVGIIYIFLNALRWLDPIFEWLSGHWSSQTVATIVLMLTVGGAIAFIVGPNRAKENKGG